jgi:hypothetical protein
MQDIVIDKTWDSKTLPAQHHTNVVLTLTLETLWIEIDAPFHNDPPPRTPAGFTDGLWAFEVVELFIVGQQHRYIELEFGPHGHYLGYRFNGVRNRTGVVSQISSTTTILGNRWHAKARVSLAALPPKSTTGWSLNATAIHGTATARCYHSHSALTGDLPDFHQPDNFTTPLIG